MTTNNNNDTATIAKDIKTSLYIAALDRYLGLRGFTSAITDGETGLDYDFLHLASGTFVKIIDPLDTTNVNRYQKARPVQCVFIVDASTLTLPPDEARTSILDCEAVCSATLVLDAYVYLKDKFWTVGEENCEWTPMLPFERLLCVKALSNINAE